MRKFLLPLVLMLVLAFGAQAESLAPGATGIPLSAAVAPEGGTAVYVQPMEASGIAATLEKGEKVTVEALGLYWCKAAFGSEGGTGYVPTAALLFDDFGSLENPEAGPRFAVFNVGMSPSGNWTMTLREGAGRKAAKMGSCIAGTVMLVLEKGKEYSLVHVGDKVGYLLTKYLTFYDAAMVSEKYAVVKNDGNVNLRYDRRFGDTGISASLAPGTVVTLIWDKKGWSCVETDGLQGYVVSTFLDAAD